MSHDDRSMPAPAPYAGTVMALLTQHEKERVLGPILVDGVGATLQVVRDVDTDALGTFTRDVPRRASQRETARTKARLAAERSGRPVGLGSEGSCVPGPLGLGSWNVELVVLADLERGIEIVGRHAGPLLHVHGFMRDPAELEDFAHAAGFPEHALVVRPDSEDDPRMRKGLRTWDELRAAVDEARARSETGRVFLENDLRAHVHPTRMQAIASAGRDLVDRIRSACPRCGMPGFGAAETIPGLPCRVCRTPTDEALDVEFRCAHCAHAERRSGGAAAFAEPSRCPFCNP